MLVVGGAANNVNANIAIKWPTTILAQGISYDSSTGLAVAPRVGWYSVSVQTQGAITAGNYIYCSVNGATSASTSNPITVWFHVTNLPATGSCLVYIGTAGHTISFRPSANQSAGGASTDVVSIVWLGE